MITNIRQYITQFEKQHGRKAKIDIGFTPFKNSFFLNKKLMFTIDNMLGSWRMFLHDDFKQNYEIIYENNFIETIIVNIRNYTQQNIIDFEKFKNLSVICFMDKCYINQNNFDFLFDRNNINKIILPKPMFHVTDLSNIYLYQQITGCKIIQL